MPNSDSNILVNWIPKSSMSYLRPNRSYLTTWQQISPCLCVPKWLLRLKSRLWFATANRPGSNCTSKSKLRHDHIEPFQTGLYSRRQLALRKGIVSLVNSNATVHPKIRITFGTPDQSCIVSNTNSNNRAYNALDLFNDSISQLSRG